MFSLNYLLGRPELREILGDDLVTDLHVLLVDKFGDNLRNRLAHGLISHNQFFNPTIVYAWWLCLFMVLLPVALEPNQTEQRVQSKNDADIK